MPRRFRGLPWAIKVLVLSGSVILLGVIGSCILVVVALISASGGGGRPAAGADSPAEADIRNRELLASLPIYARSIVIEEDVWDEYCCHPIERYRLLTYVYASDATMEEIRAFYGARLTEAGWEDGDAVVGGRGFHKKHIVLITTPLGRIPSGDFTGTGLETLEQVSVNSTEVPPADASTFFAVTVKRRIDCLGLDCFKW
jgi:hypothetical protein